jgi:hypothetical protein
MVTAKAANSRTESCRRVFLRRALLGGAALAFPSGGIVANAFAQPAAPASRLVDRLRISGSGRIAAARV